jgi:hypothetical protein
MGYFEGLADASFKKDSNGNNVFYPWGVLGKGRVLPDEATKIKLRMFVIRYYQIILPVAILLGILRLWLPAILVLILLTLGFYLYVNLLTKDCPICTEKLTLKESYKNSANSHNTLMLWLLLLVSLLFMMGGIWLFFKGRLFIGLGSVVFFGLCSAVFIFMLKIKGKQNSRSS